MFLLILGIIIALLGLVLGSFNQNLRKLRWVLVLVGIVVAFLGSGTATFRQIDAGHVGVQKIFGKVQDNVLYEGLSIVNPLASVIEISTQTKNYTMSSVTDEGQKLGDDAIRVLAADGLEVTIDMTVLYRVLPQDAPRIIREIGEDFENKIVRPLTRTRVRDNAVAFSAVELYSTKREAFQTNIKTSIEKDFRDRGLVLEQLLVRNITLPASVKESIERKITAIQDAQRMEYVLEKGKQEAELKRVEARGVADAQQILSSALSDKVLQYEMIKAQRELANSQNSKIIIMGGGKGVPLMLSDK
ncbi:MAG: prohibitin family protein [Candidatus Kapabacteria bacterium]|jgi:regulator of protease activity HflC (stomatin/prohibitin superfamily)|nr:prohibitin family protein [Candidatus Kapabacteria bacterium]